MELARLAEDGVLDFITLDDSFGPPGPGRGRLDALAVLARVAPATGRIGLVPTVTTTHTEPFHVSSSVATLDWVSRGRAGWRIEVSTTDAEARPVGRRPAAPAGELWAEAGEVADAVARLWDSWEDDAEIRDTSTGRFVDRDKLHYVDFRGAHYADVKRRLARYGRPPGELKIMPGVTLVLGGTPADAREKAVEIRRQQVSPQTAILTLEQIWGVDLSGHDPDGPLPDIDPDPGSQLVQGRVRHGDPLAVAAKWRALSEEKGLSIRQTVIEATGRQSFIGTPEAVAAEMAEFVAADAADGFILVPHLTPGGLDDFVDRVVPLFQERGVFRTAYTGPTLRDHLGLTNPGERG